MLKLNLGCADRLMEGFVNVDIAWPDTFPLNGPVYNFQIVDLAGPWPWETSSVDEVVALDVMEHIGALSPAPYGSGIPMYPFSRNAIPMYPYSDRTPFIDNGRIHFMNELHRVLKPGSRAKLETPNAAHGVGYFQDPTHVSPWCLSSFKYFELKAFAHTRLAKAYGITAAFRVWQLEEQLSNGEDSREKVWKIHAELEAMK